MGVELAMLAIALNAGIVGREAYVVIVLMIFLTTLVTPPLLKMASEVVKKKRRSSSNSLERPDVFSTFLKSPENSTGGSHDGNEPEADEEANEAAGH